MPDKGPAFLPLSQYLSLPRSKEAWLLENLLPTSGKMLIYSPPKLGKSYLAIQLAQALSGGSPDWMGFAVKTVGRVLYMQLDTPPSTWRARFDRIREHGVVLNENIILGDESTIGEYFYPFDALQPAHIEWLSAAIHSQKVDCVIIDTLRKAHSGEENSSTIMSQVMSNLRKATFPAALVVISHDKKPVQDMEKDIMYDHRGSGGVVGEMDAVIRLTRARMYYAGRDIEPDSIKVIKQEFDDVLLWMPDPNEYGKTIDIVMEDRSLHPEGKLWVATRQRARALTGMIAGKSEDGAMSALRRAAGKYRHSARLAEKIAEQTASTEPIALGPEWVEEKAT